MNTRATHPTPTTGTARFPTLPFIWAAIASALVGGFGLGALLAFGPLLGASVIVWSRAGAQAHGHAQIVGWGGLMILGVALHVLPRLRGAPLAWPGWQPWSLGLLATGVGLRLVGQPLAAMLTPASLATLVGWLGLALSGLLEVAGVSLALAMLLATHRRAPSLRERPAARPVMPLLALGLLSFLLVLLLTTGLGVQAALQGVAVLAEAGNSLAGEIGLFGFLAPICIGFSSRFLPLYLGVRPATTRPLVVTTALLAAGLIGLLAARWWPDVRPAGDLLLGLGLLVGAWAIGQRPDGRPLGLLWPPPPRAPLSPTASAALLLVRSAYGWFLVAAVLLLLGGAAPLGWAPPPDAARHALGAGYISLLILGIGALLLPGLIGCHPPTAGPVRVALWLGNLAVAARVAPVVVAWLLPGLTPAALYWLFLGTAGLLGLANPICLALITRGGPPQVIRVTPFAPKPPGAG